ncbi:MAG: patatin-like phospholipase family protein [Actinobacteria bacterium]|nr:patatin-like phospholipase family protein [Actinomycetota bacterium]MCL5883258.1 patatin-like phospholipase family protein [Actinomycetota bacterium]
MTKNMNERFQILSLDGGGIKGLFSAAVLACLEEDHGTQVTNHFDLIVGTSTGGIIALGLGMGMRPHEIVRFYIERGPDIFSGGRLASLKCGFRNKYDGAELERALKDCFGEKRLADSHKRLVVAAYNIGEDDVYLFKTPHHDRLKRDYKVPAWKVAMATSAAPTYFPSFRKLDHVRLVDGGIWANNPSMVGITEAVSMLDVPLSAIRVLSLGTTDEVKGRPKKLDRGGICQWGAQAIEVILRGQSIGATNQAKRLLGPDRVFRLDPKVPDGIFKLDLLKERELLAKAAHESRHFSPAFYTDFMEHIAPKFKPLHI